MASTHMKRRAFQKLASQLLCLLLDGEQREGGGGQTGWCQEGQREGIAPGCPRVLLGKKHGSAVTHLSSQERVKKQKKAAPSEEDDSGVEVYYREGEEEIETRALPTVRDSITWGRRASSGRGVLDSA